MSSKINNIYGETPKIKKKTRSKMKEERVEYDKEEDVENKYVNVENEEEDNAKN